MSRLRSWHLTIFGTYLFLTKEKEDLKNGGETLTSGLNLHHNRINVAQGWVGRLQMSALVLEIQAKKVSDLTEAYHT